MAASAVVMIAAESFRMRTCRGLLIIAA
jgi:hypothetical protein